MDLLRGNIKTLYFKYLSAAFGSALISSIYGIVDMAMVGQYQGPDGTAALAVVAGLGTEPRLKPRPVRKIITGIRHSRKSPGRSTAPSGRTACGTG